MSTNFYNFIGALACAFIVTGTVALAGLLIYGALDRPAPRFTALFIGSIVATLVVAIVWHLVR